MKIPRIILSFLICYMFFNFCAYGKTIEYKSVPSENFSNKINTCSLLTDTLISGKITGLIQNDHRSPVEYVTLTLVRAIDSSFVINTLSDTYGKYQFTGIKQGVYKIKISAVGYQQMITPEFNLGLNVTLNLDPIALTSLPETLHEVKISGTRPLVETKSDRFVLNVANSPLASGNSLQLLKSLPFVQVSSDNVVALQGKKTLILIDNKPVPDVSLQDILLSLPSGNILKVELITHPSSKYDAAYGAVINITTKKSLIEGVTGNVRAEGSLGLYGRSDLNSKITYKHKGLTLFGTGGLNKSDILFENNSTRILSNISPVYVLENNLKRVSHNDVYNFQAGADLELDKNQTIGFLINGNDLHGNGPWTTNNSFGKQGEVKDSILNTNSSYKLKLSTFNYNINYHLVSDSGKNDLTFLGTYTSFNRNLFQYFPSVLLNAAGETLRVPSIYQTTNLSDINIYMAQVDYSHIFKHQWTLESGLKYQNTDSKSAVDYQSVNNGQFVHNPGFSSDNSINEAISSAYGILSKDWKDDKLQVGVRVETTKATYYGYFSQNYFNAFPTLMYLHNFSSDYNLSLSYKRTVNRAPYAELVPYTVFINQYNVLEGNPALKPEYDNVYSLTTNIHKLNLSVNYTSSKGMFGLFPKSQDNITKVTRFSQQNLDKSTDWSLYLFYPLKFTSWWECQNSGTILGYNRAEGQVLGSSYAMSAFHSDFRSSHTFKISKILKLQADVYYWTSYMQSLSTYSGYKNLDAALLIDVMKGKGQIRLSGSEVILKRNDYHLDQNFNGYASREIFNTDSRRVSIGFTYNFGKTTISSSDKKMGNEDAIRRL